MTRTDRLFMFLVSSVMALSIVFGSVALGVADPASLHINGDNSPTADINWNGKRISGVRSVKAKAGINSVTGDDLDLYGGSAVNGISGNVNIGPGPVTGSGTGGVANIKDYLGNIVEKVYADGTVEFNGTAGVRFQRLTPSTVPYLNSSRKLVSSAITPTQLGYLAGVSGPIQQQIDNAVFGGLSTTVDFLGTPIPWTTHSNTPTSVSDHVFYNSNETRFFDLYVDFTGGSEVMRIGSDSSLLYLAEFNRLGGLTLLSAENEDALKMKASAPQGYTGTIWTTSDDSRSGEWYLSGGVNRFGFAGGLAGLEDVFMEFDLENMLINMEKPLDLRGQGLPDNKTVLTTHSVAVDDFTDLLFYNSDESKAFNIGFDFDGEVMGFAYTDGGSVVTFGADRATRFFGTVTFDAGPFGITPAFKSHTQTVTGQQAWESFNSTESRSFGFYFDFTGGDEFVTLASDTTQIMTCHRSGGCDFTGALVPSGGIRNKVSTANVSNPPTNAELISAFGTASAVGSGFTALVDDNNGHANEYLIWSDGTKYWYATGTAAP